MSFEEETGVIFHPTTRVFLPLIIFAQEANREGYTYWLDYLEYLDNQDDGNDEEEEEEEEEEGDEDEEKKTRIAEMRKEDAKESNQSLVYSRECKICFTPNPLSRSIFTVCGHWSCLPCGETLSVDGSLSCPFCRMDTRWVKMIENEEEKTDPSMSSSSSSIGSNEEDSSVLHPTTGEIISFEHLRREANMRGFHDPFHYLEYLDPPQYSISDTDDSVDMEEDQAI